MDGVVVRPVEICYLVASILVHGHAMRVSAEPVRSLSNPSAIAGR